MPNKYLDSEGLAEYTSLVKTALDGKADVNSPALTGTPTAPTPTAGDDSTKIATTEFVQDAIDSEETRADGAYLPLTGGSVTGNLTVSGTITGDVTGTASGNLPLSGGTLTGNVNFSGSQLLEFGSSSHADGTGGFIGRTGTGIRIASEAFGYADAGGYIDLDGQSIGTTNAGRFIITARSDSSTAKALVGKADGTLTWGGTSVAVGSFLPLSGGTLTGNVTINKSKPTIIIKDSNIARAATPSENYATIEVVGQDNNSKSTWGLYHRYNTDKSHRIDLICYKGTTNDTAWTGIGVGYDSSGTAYTYAPTPAANNNSTQIATTAWVQGNVKNTLTVQTKTGSAVSVNAGAVYSNATVNVALTGYTPLGVVGWEVTGTNASYAMIFKVDLNGTTVNISGRNMASSAASWTPKVNVLYVKN